MYIAILGTRYTEQTFPRQISPSSTQLLDNKTRSKVLCRCIVRILEVLSIDTKSMRRITDSIALITLANILKSQI